MPLSVSGLVPHPDDHRHFFIPLWPSRTVRAPPLAVGLCHSHAREGNSSGSVRKPVDRAQNPGGNLFRRSNSGRSPPLLIVSHDSLRGMKPIPKATAVTLAAEEDGGRWKLIAEFLSQVNGIEESVRH